MKTPADAFLFYPQVMKGANSIDLAQFGLSWFQDTDRTRTPGHIQAGRVAQTGAHALA